MKVINNKSKVLYEVLGKTLMKHPDTREWLDAIRYTDGSKEYTREYQDFITKFTTVFYDR